MVILPSLFFLLLYIGTVCIVTNFSAIFSLLLVQFISLLLLLLLPPPASPCRLLLNYLFPHLLFFFLCTDSPIKYPGISIYLSSRTLLALKSHPASTRVVSNRTPKLFMMTIRAAKFTPEVLLSAPRRSAGIPNSTGKLVLYTVSESGSSTASQLLLPLADQTARHRHTLLRSTGRLVRFRSWTSSPAFQPGCTRMAATASQHGSARRKSFCSRAARRAHQAWYLQT